MTSYEVRVLDEAGPTLIFHRHHADDRSAIEAAKAIAGDKAFDLWRGMECLFISDGLCGLVAQ